MLLNKTQVNTILNNAPVGADKTKILDSLITKGYEIEGVNTSEAKKRIATQQTLTEQASKKTEAPAEEPGYLDRIKENVGEDINNRTEKVGKILNRTDTGAFEKFIQVFGQGSGLAANAMEKVVGEVPGIKQAFGALGSGIKWLATSDYSPAKKVGDLIGNSKHLQDVVHLYDTDENFKDTVDGVANIARLGGDVQSAVDSVNFVKNVTEKLADRIKSSPLKNTITDHLKTADTEFKELGDVAPKATPDDFVKSPHDIRLFRGENELGDQGLHFSTDPSWAKKFGDKVVAGNLPEGAKVYHLTGDEFKDAFSRGLKGENAVFKEFFDKGYDAVVGTDGMNSHITDVIVNPKLLNTFQEVKNAGGAAGLGNDLINQNRQNIVMQLKDMGLTSQAEKIAKIDLSKVNTMAQYQSAIQDATTSSGHIADLTGAVKNTLDVVKKNTKALAEKFTGGGVDGSDLKATLDPEILARTKADPNFGKLVKDAQKQGFKDADVNFLSTVSETDKPVMKKMFDLAVKAQSNPRQIQRAGDVLGENVLNQVKQVQTLNSEAGKAVDVAAKALKGQAVDVAPLENKITSTLENAGITINGNKLDFSGSVFKNVPQIQKELQKVFETIPDGSDAYQMHIFKKGLDETLNYGTAGEGLSGQASRILKSIRAATDDVLDENFKSYNEANTKYKETIDFLEEAKGVAGKKTDLTTKEGSQAFGQALRSAFSNNKSRGATLSFIENVQKIGKQLKLKGADQDILDQAIFVTLLEDTFGSEAATGLAGEVTKAINKAKTGVKVLRNPVMGSLDVAADVLEKAQGITPEAKKKILEMFISQKAK